MPMKLKDIITGLQAVADERGAEPWDKVGLHLGDPNRSVGRGLLCIDLTQAVVAEAIQKRCELVVAYHPPIFRPLERLTADGPWTQRRILMAVQAGLAVYSPHTALDAAVGGVCDWLCDVIADGAEDSTRRPIAPKFIESKAKSTFKIVVFVPEAEEVALRQAMSRAGAGTGGGVGGGVGGEVRYRECSFSSSGIGGFLPLDGANPAVGRVGERTEVAERRLEMLVPADRLSAVAAAIHAAHPYEEPAFDVLRREQVPPVDHPDGNHAVGAGRVLSLAEPITAAQLAARFTPALFPEAIVKLGSRPTGPITSVAVCPGSGGGLFESVEADAYVTGEMQHHACLDLVERGKTVILLGHTASERPYLPVYRDRLDTAFARGDHPGAQWLISEADRAPLTLRDA